MRIAQIASFDETVPPARYGGTERVVSHLTEELVSLGHDVTLFAANGSRTRARLVTTRECSLRLDQALLISRHASSMAVLNKVSACRDDFDIMHFHTDMIHFPAFEACAGRTLTTVHGRLDVKDLPHVYYRWDDYPLVSISMAQRKPISKAHWFSNVPHGIDPTPYRVKPDPRQDYLVFLGRISPEKRPDRAIAIARRAGLPLKIAAKVDSFDSLYFEQIIRPLIEPPHVEFLGEIDDERKAELLGQARALLFTIDWPEPFGLVMIEAMACGTPVIAWRHGSVPEVVDHGVTGFIVDDEDEAVDAVARAGELDRQRIREVFEHRFTARTMALAYENLYRRLLRPRDAEDDAYASPAR